MRVGIRRIELLASILAALALTGCEPDKAAVQREALAIIARRPAQPIQHVEPMCPAGAQSKALPHCMLSDLDRAKYTAGAKETLAEHGSFFMDEVREMRDELAAAIVRDPGLVDRLVRYEARVVVCPTSIRTTCDQDRGVAAVQAQVENAYAATLADGLRGGPLTANFKGVWHAPGALSEVEKLSDYDLIAVEASRPEADLERRRILGVIKTSGHGHGRH